MADELKNCPNCGGTLDDTVEHLKKMYNSIKKFYPRRAKFVVVCNPKHRATVLECVKKMGRTRIANVIGTSAASENMMWMVEASVLKEVGEEDV